MTTTRYPQGCAPGSEVRGEAWAGSPGSYAWNVNFNNGNADNDHHDNNGFVRAVRSVARASAGEYQGAGQVTLRALYDAWRAARRKKVPSDNQLAFDSCWLDRLLELQEQLEAGTWRPGPTTCFVAKRPKAREIHAPDFGDRVVHHWLVPQLEAVYEPTFIHDSYSNRRGKGTHAAVDRLRTFLRQVEDGEGGGWYLQLDVRNFFNSIHRPTLYARLKRRLERAGVPLAARRAAHALLRTSPTNAGVQHRSTAEERALVPPHKRLENAAPGCGLPIGNLSSQFFANVYLDALDQFVKHELKVPRYLRYVDDFVIVHRDRAQLERWHAAIARFLRDRLRLELKREFRLQPIAGGVDFLGYLVQPHRTRVRRRVVRHARAALVAWAHGRVGVGCVRATPRALDALRATWASYLGHFRHADTAQLRADFARRFPWLRSLAERRRRFDVAVLDRVRRFRVCKTS